MQIEKLFQVLVVGGALLSGPIMAHTNTMESCRDAGFEFSESGDALKPILCDKEDACVTTCDGTKKVKDGFECCWGTRCE